LALDIITSFFIAFGLIFIAELGDKTQLIVLTLASRGYNSKLLAFGAVMGFGVIVFLGGMIALVITKYIDLMWISVISGCVFAILGTIQLRTLILNKKKGIREDSSVENEEIPKVQSKNSFLMGFLAIVTMELGDKTQLMTIVLAAQSPSMIGTLLGSWAALSSLAVFGAFAGQWLSKKVPKEKIDWISAFLFLLIGIIIIITSF
jgi:putative Ca2+/H+ antiporter (TMEM165/GDT1 family)